MFFKARNYLSFVRQLNKYGFNKQKNRNGTIEFKHEFFRRGEIADLSKIERQFNKNPKKKKKNNLKNEKKEKKLCNRKEHHELNNLLNSLMKQNAKLMEANQQLLYQYFNFKNSNNLKCKKLIFLIYCLLDDEKYFHQQISNKIFENILSFNNFLQNEKNFKLIMRELELKEEDQSNTDDLHLNKMMESLFEPYKSSSNQSIDRIIKDCIEIKIKNSHEINKNYFKINYQEDLLKNQIKIQNNKIILNEDFDKKIVYQYNAKNNLPNSFKSNNNNCKFQQLLHENKISKQISPIKNLKKSKKSENNNEIINKQHSNKSKNYLK